MEKGRHRSAGDPLNIQLSNKTAHACEKTALNWGNNYPKGLKETIVGAHIGPRIVCNLTSQSENLIIHGALSRGLRGIASLVGKINPKYCPGST